MKHQDYVRRVEETARNAQGLRRLADHVRLLYSSIRELQNDDNAFCYIAEVIQTVRSDTRPPATFEARIRSYYHRHRATLGEPLVKSARTAPGTLTPSDALAPSGPAPIAPDIEDVNEPKDDLVGGADKERHDDQPVQERPPEDGVGHRSIANAGTSDAAALTAAIHGRKKRRRVVPGG